MKADREILAQKARISRVRPNYSTQLCHHQAGLNAPNFGAHSMKKSSTRNEPGTSKSTRLVGLQIAEKTPTARTASCQRLSLILLRDNGSILVTKTCHRVIGFNLDQPGPESVAAQAWVRYRAPIVVDTATSDRGLLSFQLHSHLVPLLIQVRHGGHQHLCRDAGDCRKLPPSRPFRPHSPCRGSPPAR